MAELERHPRGGLDGGGVDLVQSLAVLSGLAPRLHFRVARLFVGGPLGIAGAAAARDVVLPQ